MPKRAREIEGIRAVEGVMRPHNRRMHTARLITSLALVFAASASRADCFDTAASYQGVNPWVLRAIAFQESSFKPNTLHRNSNGTVDVGVTGTNSVHFPELRKYGIEPQHLYDSCTSIYVAAWRLKKMMVKYGNTWTAVGAYHSENQRHRDWYAARIKQIVDWWAARGYVR